MVAWRRAWQGARWPPRCSKRVSRGRAHNDERTAPAVVMRSGALAGVCSHRIAHGCGGVRAAMRAPSGRRR
eukprot:3706197-Prymnesium_polylepis.2